MKKDLIAIIIMLVMGFIISFLFYRNRELKQEKEDQKVILTETASIYRTKFETEAMRNTVWQMQYKDVKSILSQRDDQLTEQERIIKNLAKKVDEMGISIRNVEYAFTGRVSSKLDSTLRWSIDSLNRLTPKRVRYFELAKGSWRVKVTDYVDSVRFQKEQSLSLYGALHNTKRWSSGKEIRYPRLAFWKEWRIEGDITTNDREIHIDSVYFLNPNR